MTFPDENTELPVVEIGTFKKGIALKNAPLIKMSSRSNFCIEQLVKYFGDLL